MVPPENFSLGFFLPLVSGRQSGIADRYWLIPLYCPGWILSALMMLGFWWAIWMFGLRWHCFPNSQAKSKRSFVLQLEETLTVEQIGAGWRGWSGQCFLASKYWFQEKFKWPNLWCHLSSFSSEQYQGSCSDNQPHLTNLNQQILVTVKSCLLLGDPLVALGQSASWEDFNVVDMGIPNYIHLEKALTLSLQSHWAVDHWCVPSLSLVGKESENWRDGCWALGHNEPLIKEWPHNHNSLALSTALFLFHPHALLHSFLANH